MTGTDTSGLRPLTEKKAVEFLNRLKSLALQAIDAEIPVYIASDKSPGEFTLVFAFAEAGMDVPAELLELARAKGGAR